MLISNINVLSKKNIKTKIIEYYTMKDNYYIVNLDCEKIFNTKVFNNTIKELLNCSFSEEESSTNNRSQIQEENIIILYSNFDKLLIDDSFRRKNIVDIIFDNEYFKELKENTTNFNNKINSNGKNHYIYLDYSESIFSDFDIEILCDVLATVLLQNISLTDFTRKKYYDRFNNIYSKIILACVQDNFELLSELCLEIINIEKNLLPLILQTTNITNDDERLFSYSSELNLLLYRGRYNNKLPLISKYLNNINYDPSLNSQDKLDIDNLRIKVNDMQTKLIAEFTNVNSKLEFLKESFEDSIKYDAYKNELFNNMHKELTQYKNGILEKIVDTMAMDIIRIIDTTNKNIDIYINEEYSEHNYKKLLKLFVGVSEDLKDILFRQSIESYSVDGIDVDVKKQKIISNVLTTDKTLDNKIASRIVDGYEKNGKILRPERVNIYKYKV